MIALSELYAPATPMHPSSTRYRKPSVAFFAEPCGSPFSACSTNSTGRSSRPCSDGLVEREAVDLVVAAAGSVERRTQPADLDRFHGIPLAGRAPCAQLVYCIHIAAACKMSARPSVSTVDDIARTTTRTTPAIDADPYPVWKRLRDDAPLYYNEQYDFYALSRFADVLRGVARLADVQLGARHRARDDRHDTPVADGTAESDASLGMMIFMDPPRHDELRRLVSRAFTPRRVAALDGAHPRAVRRVPRPATRRSAASTTSRTSRPRSRRWSSARCSASRTTTRTSSASGAT